MGAIIILVGHNHYRTISQVSCRVVAFAKGKPHNFDNIGELIVIHNLFIGHFSNIYDFSPQWKYSVQISSQMLNATHG